MYALFQVTGGKEALKCHLVLYFTLSSWLGSGISFNAHRDKPRGSRGAPAALERAGSGTSAASASVLVAWVGTGIQHGLEHSPLHTVVSQDFLVIFWPKKQ